MGKKKNNVLFQEDWYNLMKPMPDASFGKVAKAIFAKAFENIDADLQAMEPMEQMAVSFIVPKMLETRENYELRCQHNRENANKRWHSDNMQSDAMAYNGMQSDAIALEKEKEIERETEKEKETETETERGVGASASLASSFSDIDLSSFDGQLMPLVIEWCRVLQQIGIAPNTDYMKHESDRLLNYSHGSIEKAKRILTFAIQRKWKHIFDEPKPKNNNSNTGVVINTQGKDYTQGLERLTGAN